MRGLWAMTVPKHWDRIFSFQYSTREATNLSQMQMKKKYLHNEVHRKSIII